MTPPTLSNPPPPPARPSPTFPRPFLYQVAGGHEIDDDSWVREWSSREPLTLTASVAARKEEDGGAASSSCPACSGPLRAVGLTDGERARIRETLFGLAGLQVKKHARSRYCVEVLRKGKQEGGGGAQEREEGCMLSWSEVFSRVCVFLRRPAG